MLKYVIVALILLLLFGGKRLGDLGKGLGEGIRGFKKAIGDQPPRPAAPKPNGSETPSAPAQLEGRRTPDDEASP